VAFALPLLLMLLTSFKSLPQINDGSLFAPAHHPTLTAWSRAWGHACIGESCHGISQGIANSFAVVIPALLLSLCLGLITGFALNVRVSRNTDLLFGSLLIGLFIPPQLTLFPMIVSLRALGLFGTRPGLILVHVIWGLPFLTLLFRNFFRSLPRELWNTVRIDGIGFWTILGRVMLPMSWPICVVAFVLQFTFLWNDFLLGLTFAGVGHEPITVALNVLAGPHLGPQEYNVIMAAAAIAAAPTILLYMLSGPLLMRGFALPKL
jgi:glucose/mannose transport system permease protein